MNAAKTRDDTHVLPIVGFAFASMPKRLAMHRKQRLFRSKMRKAAGWQLLVQCALDLWICATVCMYGPVRFVNGISVWVCAATGAGRKLLQSASNPASGAVLTPVEPAVTSPSGAVITPAMPALATYTTTPSSSHPYLSWCHTCRPSLMVPHITPSRSHTKVAHQFTLLDDV